MNPGKSPGNDWLTTALYKAIWKYIHAPLFCCYKEIMEEGEMAPSQKQSVIRLIRKKGKDDSLLKNWRPISLLNIDTKIFSKIIAMRIEGCLPEIIDINQSAFIKGRNIVEGIRTTDMIIEQLEKENRQGIIIGVDFLKAFDSVDHEYLVNILEAYGFPNMTIRMIKILYNGAESAIINHGITSTFFNLLRSCRQGDALSPFLFIISIDPLLRKLIQNPLNKGIKTATGTIKAISFADDLDNFTNDIDAAKSALDIIFRFANLSGLHMNTAKSELLGLGNFEKEDINLSDIPKVNMLKVTGIFVGNKSHSDTIVMSNFDTIVDKLRAKLNMWRGRDLSLVGRALIVKAIGISQIRYAASVIEVPEKYIKIFKGIIYRFLWKGPDRITRDMASKRWQEGGIKMPILDDIITASNIQWLKRAATSKNVWASNFRKEVGKKLGNSMLRGNLDMNKLATTNMSDFTMRILKSWKKFKGDSHQEDYLSEPVWYNLRFMNLATKTLTSEYLARWGYSCVRNFLDIDGRILKSREAIGRGLPQKAALEWMAVTSSINMDKVNESNFLYGDCPETISPTLIDANYLDQDIDINNQNVTLSTLTQAYILADIAERKPVKWAPYKKRIMEQYEITEDDWGKAYKRTNKLSVASRRTSFYYSYLHGLVYTNKDYFRFGFRASPKCTFCDCDRQTMQHLFMDCSEIIQFKQALEAFVLNGIRLTDKDWLMGHASKTIHFIIMEALWYIYTLNLAGRQPSIYEFKGSLRTTESLEYAVASTKNKQLAHLAKWDFINSAFFPS